MLLICVDILIRPGPFLSKGLWTLSTSFFNFLLVFSTSSIFKSRMKSGHSSCCHLTAHKLLMSFVSASGREAMSQHHLPLTLLWWSDVEEQYFTLLQHPTLSAFIHICLSSFPLAPVVFCLLQTLPRFLSQSENSIGSIGYEWDSVRWHSSPHPQRARDGWWNLSWSGYLSKG